MKLCDSNLKITRCDINFVCKFRFIGITKNHEKLTCYIGLNRSWDENPVLIKAILEGGDRKRFWRHVQLNLFSISCAEYPKIIIVDSLQTPCIRQNSIQFCLTTSRGIGRDPPVCRERDVPDQDLVRADRGVHYSGSRSQPLPQAHLVHHILHLHCLRPATSTSLGRHHRRPNTRLCSSALLLLQPGLQIPRTALENGDHYNTKFNFYYWNAN